MQEELDSLPGRLICPFSAAVFAASLAFLGFFALSKRPPLVAANSFAGDPYDVVGSFAFQLAVAVSLLNLARARRKPNRNRSPYIMRGGAISLLAIGSALVADWAAVLRWTGMVTGTSWGQVLLAGLLGLSALTAGLVAWLVSAVHRWPELWFNPGPGSLDQAVRDLTSLLFLPYTLFKGKSRRPQKFLTFYEELVAAAYRKANPDQYPWIWTSAAALLLGAGLAFMQLVLEGPAPHLIQALLVSGIFIIGETTFVLLAYKLVGGFLGLVPPRSRAEGPV